MDSVSFFRCRHVHRSCPPSPGRRRGECSSTLAGGAPIRAAGSKRHAGENRELPDALSPPHGPPSEIAAEQIRAAAFIESST